MKELKKQAENYIDSELERLGAECRARENQEEAGLREIVTSTIKSFFTGEQLFPKGTKLNLDGYADRMHGCSSTDIFYDVEGRLVMMLEQTDGNGNDPHHFPKYNPDTVYREVNRLETYKIKSIFRQLQSL